jgi:prophage antirepressor-like protein
MYPTENCIVSGPAQLAGPVVVEERRFHDQRIRVVTVDGVAQFVAMDVAAILEYANTRQAVHMHVSKGNRDAVCLTDAIGRMQRLTTVNEAGLYELIMGSEKPAAREFRQWVVSEVLPSIRETGRYELETGRYELKTATVPLMEQIAAALHGRGAAKGRQLNKVIAHRDGTFSIRIGKYWVRNLSTLNVAGLPLSHTLREGRALSAVREGPGPAKRLIQ